jgi:hypothetical protein
MAKFSLCMGYTIYQKKSRAASCRCLLPMSLVFDESRKTFFFSEYAELLSWPYTNQIGLSTLDLSEMQPAHEVIISTPP